MKVWELIEKLEQFPEECQVVIPSADDELMTVTEVTGQEIVIAGDGDLRYPANYNRDWKREKGVKLN